MKFFHQLYKHSPENGYYGDCFRTCIGCFLDMEPHTVPHWFKMDHTAPQDEVDRAYSEMRSWLEAKGYQYYTAPYIGQLDDVLKCMGYYNPGIPYILCGSSGTANHAVLARGDQIIHDPNPEKPGLVGPSNDGYLWVHLLVPIFKEEK